MNNIISINNNDVLIGIGTATHPGTVAYQELVDRYVSNLSQKSERNWTSDVAREIMYHIASLDPPGRFVKKTREQTYERIEDQEARSEKKDNACIDRKGKKGEKSEHSKSIS